MKTRSQDRNKLLADDGSFYRDESSDLDMSGASASSGPRNRNRTKSFSDGEGEPLGLPENASYSDSSDCHHYSRSSGASFLETPEKIYPSLDNFHTSGSASYNYSPNTSFTGKDSPKLKQQYGVKVPEAKKNDGCRNYVNLMLIAILFVLVTLCFCYMILFHSGETKIIASSKSEAFNAEFRDVMKKFPKQSERSWRMIKSSLLSVMLPSPAVLLKPAVLMFVADKKSTKSLHCVTGHLTKLLNTSPEASSFTVDGNDFIHLGSDDAKEKLENDLRSGFGAGHKTVLLKDVHIFKAGMLLLLHAYCDHETAPYKDVYIVMNSEVKSLSGSDREIEGTITDSWTKDVEINEVGALASRLLKNVVIIRAEDEDILSKHCT